MFWKSIVPVALVLAACAGASGPSITVETASGVLTLDAPPSAIVSLSPTATEMLFAIGAGDRVVAVDDQSDHPADAPMTDLSGFTPNIEAIATYAPDLVVVAYDPGDLISGLSALGVPVLVLPAAETLEDVYAQLELLGEVTGADGSVVIESIKGEVAAIVAGADAAGKTYYHELDPTFYSVTSSTFIGHLYSLIGMVNIADPADVDGYGYPQLSAEFVIENDPDLIVLADTVCCGVDAAGVAARPGWSSLKAVRNGDVVEADDSVASRWGPRLVDFLRLIAGAASR